MDRLTLTSPPRKALTLDALKSRLSCIHQGYWQQTDYLDSWFSPSMLRLFEAHAEFIPTSPRVALDVREEHHCLENMLAYCVEHPAARGFFGFGFFVEADGTPRWWIHGAALDRGSFIDPARIPTVAYYGVRVGVEWWSAITKKPGASLTPDQLPEVLRTPAYSPVSEPSKSA